MKLIKKLIDCLWVFIHPRFWLMNYPYEEKWEKFVQEAVLDGHFTDITEYTAKLNGVQVWINNYPYAAFTNYPSAQFRPARKTIYELRKKLVRDIIAETLKIKEV